MDIVREIFPGRLQDRMEKALAIVKDAQEIRIRVNTPIMICANGKEFFVTNIGQVTERRNTTDYMAAKDLDDIVSHICRSSLYAYEEEVKRGYLTIEGGHRVGITGRAVPDGNGNIRTIRNICFLNVRIAHEVPGSASRVLEKIYENGKIKNTLIVSPPGYGKTTLLRDLLRSVSNGNIYGKGKQCCVIDERSEVAGCFRGIPQLDVGVRTDVMDGCPKVVGMMMAIRSMGPQVLAVDELGTAQDVQALFSVIRSGCGILATIHGEGLRELKEKSFLKEVIMEKVFERYIVIYPQYRLEIFDKEFRIC